MVDLDLDAKEEMKDIQFDSSFTTKVGDYQLLKLIGKGSFGNVYMAANKQGKIVALKEIKHNTDARSLKRIQNEISILTAIRHQNVIELYDVIQDIPNGIFLSIEYCPGGDLLQYLRKRKKLSELEVQEIVYQLGSGLKELYRRNIMHRDIKLQNLLITSEEDIKVKIADFGLARYSAGYASTYCGTLAYMAPEIIQGQKYSTKAELWSLGVTIYVLLTGKMLFKSKAKILSNILDATSSIGEKINKLKVSKTCKDLLRQLLVIDHKIRMTSAKFFAHPFVKTVPARYKEEHKGKCKLKSSKQIVESEDSDVEKFMKLLSSGAGTEFYCSDPEHC